MLTDKFGYVYHAAGRSDGEPAMFGGILQTTRPLSEADVRRSIVRAEPAVDESPLTDLLYSEISWKEVVGGVGNNQDQE
jgi:hypothetical protein